MSLNTHPSLNILVPILQAYNNGIFGFVLNSIHSFWWANARKEEVILAPSKIQYLLQFLAGAYFLNNDASRYFIKLVFYIAKLDEINNAFTKKREAYANVVRAWNGEYIFQKNPFLNRLKVTIYKIAIYLKETFCFFMTCVDAAKSVNFDERAQIDALSNLIRNTTRVGRLLLFADEAEELKNSLDRNIQFIQFCFGCNEDEAHLHVGSIHACITRINPLLLSQKTSLVTTWYEKLELLR